MVKERIKHRIYINVHRVQRAFGGPEEGGWFYSQGEPVESIHTRVCYCDLPTVTSPASQCWDSGEVLPRRRLLDIGFDNHETDCRLWELWQATEDRYLEHKDQAFRQADGDDSDLLRGEALSSGEIQVSIDTKPGAAFPEFRPFYS